jgi:hypothetical protein
MTTRNSMARSWLTTCWRGLMGARSRFEERGAMSIGPLLFGYRLSG